MRLNTSSAVIALAGEWEEKAAAFYETLAGRYPALAETFLDLARENRKNKAQVERAYYGAVTDAIESSFTFDLAADDYRPDFTLPTGTSLGDALGRAGAVEEKIAGFYREAAGQSRRLLADIPRVLTLIGRKREGRQARLAALGVGPNIDEVGK